VSDNLNGDFYSGVGKERGSLSICNYNKDFSDPWNVHVNASDAELDLSIVRVPIDAIVFWFGSFFAPPVRARLLMFFRVGNPCIDNVDGLHPFFFKK